ncbi:MAG TPA: acetyltransferase [Gammaproteobacteria bacterium]|nr:acetyltransferase [Gammaproteobacteria bacterium]
MFLKHSTKDDLVEILSLNDLFDPFCKRVVGRYQHGEEAQDPEKFNKSDLQFPSGEPLPRCWLDAHYRDSAVKR